MHSITMLLKTSDVMAVRKAVFAAGASRVVVFPLSKSEREIQFKDWYFGKDNLICNAPTRVDVGVDENYVDDVISAFLTTAHVGRIGRIAKQVLKSKGHEQQFLRVA